MKLNILGISAKPRPIGFKNEMVSAIINDRKIVTRRLPEAQPLPGTEKLIPWMVDGQWQYRESGVPLFISTSESDENVSARQYGCKYGAPGDLLWVKETWGESGVFKDETAEGGIRSRYEYRALPADKTDFRSVNRWRSSMHCKREASRLLLEITELRAERLQDMTDGDALDEGVLTLSREWRAKQFPGYAQKFAEWQKLNAKLATEGYPYYPEPPAGQSPRELFAALWDLINGKTPGVRWADNPWVFVITFKKLAYGQGCAL